MILRNRVPFALPGRWAVAEVGYVAGAHAAMLEPAAGRDDTSSAATTRPRTTCARRFATSPDVDSRPFRRPAPGQGQRPGDGCPPATGQDTTLRRLPRTVDHYSMRGHRQHDHPSGTRDRTAAARADIGRHDPLDGADPAPSRETGWRPPQHITGLSVHAPAMRNPMRLRAESAARTWWTLSPTISGCLARRYRKCIPVSSHSCWTTRNMRNPG